MTDPHGYGLDVGTTTSVLCRTATAEERCFEIDGDPAVPTAIHADADQSEGVLVGPTGCAAEEPTRPLPRFRADGSDRGGSVTDQLQEFLTPALDRWGADLGGTTTVVGVPGSYPESARERVENVVGRASGAVVSSLRAPVPALAAAADALDGEALYLAVDVGAHWVDAALVTAGGESPPLTVHARRSRPGIGTERFETAVADWALRTAAREAGVDDAATVAVPDADRERLHRAASAALSDLAADGTARLHLHEPVRAAVTDGKEEETDEERPLEVDIEFDDDSAAGALDAALRELTSVVNDLFERTDIGRAAVERLFLSGGGASLPQIREWLAAAVDDTASVAVPDDPVTAAARGAGRLAYHAAQRGVDPETFVHESPMRAVDVVRIDGDAVASTPLVTAGSPYDRPYAVCLTTAVDGQRRGRIDLVDREPLTGARGRRRHVVIEGQPPRAAGEVTLELTYTPADETATVSVHEPEAGGTAGATAELLDPSADPGDAPWLAAPGSNPSASVAREPERSPRVSPDPPSYGDNTPSTRNLIERLWSVRTRVWLTDRQGEMISNEDVGGLLDSMDAALRRFDIEAIEPDPGAETDPLTHEEFMAQPANYPKGRIVQVQKPGIRIGDTVVEPAQVIVASDDTPENEAEKDGAETAESGADENGNETG